MPLSFIGAAGSRPLVTAWVMIACRFSASRSNNVPLLLNQRIDLRCLRVQKVCDALLNLWGKIVGGV